MITANSPELQVIQRAVEPVISGVYPDLTSDGLHDYLGDWLYSTKDHPTARDTYMKLSIVDRVAVLDYIVGQYSLGEN